jgi:CRP/FNR family transcriptional regulator, cyclic AMP receptor protein
MVTTSAFRELEGFMREAAIASGGYVYFDGQKAEKVFMLKSGTLKQIKTTHDGKEFMMGMASIGQILGYPDSVYGERYASSAYAVTKCTVMELPVREFQMLVESNSAIANLLIKQLSLNQMRLMTKLRDLVLFDKEVALCSTIIRLANTFGEPVPGGIRIGNKFTHREIAEMSGTTRERVNRLLTELKEQGTVSQQDGYIIVHDLEALRAICACEDCPLEVCRI